MYKPPWYKPIKNRLIMKEYKPRAYSWRFTVYVVVLNLYNLLENKYKYSWK
jgi:hypothetical protein